jgi:hypothetical protein
MACFISPETPAKNIEDLAALIARSNVSPKHLAVRE